MLSQVLNYRQISTIMPLSVANSALNISLMSPPCEPQNISNVVLALRTLGSFNFEG